jgi:hypothetical protein
MHSKLSLESPSTVFDEVKEPFKILAVAARIYTQRDAGHIRIRPQWLS